MADIFETNHAFPTSKNYTFFDETAKLTNNKQSYSCIQLRKFASTTYIFTLNLIMS